MKTLIVAMVFVSIFGCAGMREQDAREVVQDAVAIYIATHPDRVENLRTAISDLRVMVVAADAVDIDMLRDFLLDRVSKTDFDDGKKAAAVIVINRATRSLIDARARGEQIPDAVYAQTVLAWIDEVLQ